MVGRSGVPLSVMLTAANVHDSKVLEEAVDAISPIRKPERRERVIDFWVALSEVVIIVRRLIREGWSRYRWEGRLTADHSLLAEAVSCHRILSVNRTYMLVVDPRRTLQSRYPHHI